MHILIAAAALLAALPAAAADLAATFAARPAAFSAALSPDGSKLVYLSAYKTGGRAVIVADLKTGNVRAVMTSVDLSVLPLDCAFKTETRLICTLGGLIKYGEFAAGFTRVAAVDIDGKNLKVIGQRATARSYGSYSGGAVIDWLPDDPDHVLMQVEIGESDSKDTNIKATQAGTAAALVDIRTGTRRIVERSNPMTAELGSDNQGNIRMRGNVDRDPNGYARDSINYAVRAKASREWKTLFKARLSDDRAPRLVGFDDTGDHIYQLKPLDGRQALYRYSTDGTGTATLVFAHPAVDVDGVLRIGKFRRPVGATYAVERNQISYFDDKIGGLSRALSKALPGLPDTSIVDESWDGTKKLIYADSANQPGQYYLYDTTTKKLGLLAPVFPAMAGVKLGSVTAVTYAARDGTKIPGYLTLPPGRSDAKGLPALLMPHGGPSARDTSGFDWLPQFFASSGYAVLQPNFRGSAGYGDDFFAKNGFQSWQLAIGDINDGARWLVSQGADGKRLGIFGWSYGGYAALQANVAEPGLYRAIVAVAPVTDLPQLRQESTLFTNFKLVDVMIGSGPHVIAGSPARNAAAIRAPVLMFHGTVDQNVDIDQSRTMAGALRGAGKKVELIEYKDLDHSIDDSEARRDMLTRSAAFLGAALD